MFRLVSLAQTTPEVVFLRKVDNEVFCLFLLNYCFGVKCIKSFFFCLINVLGFRFFLNQQKYDEALALARTYKLDPDPGKLNIYLYYI